MGVSVFLSNNNIQIIEGTSSKNKLTPNQVISRQMEQGAVLNGVILSESVFQQEVRQIWEDFQLPKKIQLVVDSTQFFTKVLTLPKMKEKKQLELVRKEFQELENPQYYLFDYRILSTDSKTGLASVIGAAVKQSVIEDYVAAFCGVDIAVESIDIALNSYLKLFAWKEELRDKTYARVQRDENNLMAILMVDGSYSYFNRGRLFHEPGTEGYANEVAQRVNGLIQFQSTKKEETPLEDVALGGFDEESYESCKQAVEQLGVQVVGIRDDANFQATDKTIWDVEETRHNSHCLMEHYVYPLGNLIREKKDIDFLRAFKKQKPAQGKEEKIPKKYIYSVAAVFAACAVASLVVIGMNMYTNRQLQQANAYVNDSQNQEDYMTALTAEAQLTTLRASLAQAQQVKAVKDSYPHAGSQVENVIRQCAGSEVDITIDTYDASTGVYEFTAMAPQVTDISNFVDKLSQTNIFEDMEYSGYNYTDNTQQYDIQMSCYLKESAGK